METFDSTPDRPDRDRVRVGVSQYVVVTDGETLRAYGLGSTVAVALYAPPSETGTGPGPGTESETEDGTGVGGLANAVLPRRREGDDAVPAKFVDSAIQAMVKELAENGAMLGSLEAYVVGGARIMDLQDLDTGVGPENVRAARQELTGLGIPVVGEAVGGDHGRAVEFDTAAGTLTVETLDGGRRTLGPDHDPET